TSTSTSIRPSTSGSTASASVDAATSTSASNPTPSASSSEEPGGPADRWRTPIVERRGGTMKEAALIALAQDQVADETVSAAGVFQPRGTEAGLEIGEAGMSSGVGHGLAGAVGGAISLAAGSAAGRGLSVAEGLPRWTLMAVTPTHLYAFHVLSPTDGLEFE